MKIGKNLQYLINLSSTAMYMKIGKESLLSNYFYSDVHENWQKLSVYYQYKQPLSTVMYMKIGKYP